MVDFLWAVGAFIIAIGVLVTFHEYGHFWVARKLGVKVLRFSVGFGKALWKRTAKSGTEYVLAMIPLGGYVKMLDENETKVPEEQLKFAFNRKPVWARMLIVAAGPVFNFIFAIFAYWLIFTIGTVTVAPVLGHINPQSIAGQAGLSYGDEIVKVNQAPVNNWQQTSIELIAKLGDKDNITVNYKNPNSDKVNTTQLSLKHWKIDNQRPDVLKSLGFAPFKPKIPPVVKKVQPESAAAQAGIQAGDAIVAIDNITIKDWSEIPATLARLKAQTVKVTIERKNKLKTLMVYPTKITLPNNKSAYVLGISSDRIQYPKQYNRIIRYNPFEALIKGFQKTGHMIGLTFHLLYKMLVGKVSIKSISGPVGIAQSAGFTAQLGFTYFLSFLALISISLGVINLLPIPMLDGGHFLFYVIELIRGKPLSIKAQIFGFKLGMILVLALMMFAIYNDFLRLFLN